MKTQLIDFDLTNLRTNLCREARRRSRLGLNEVARLVGVSRISILAWESRSDKRLAEFWCERGFRFPPLEDQVITVDAAIGRERIVRVGCPIVDEGADAGWSDLTFTRSGKDAEDLEEHEYQVDEETGVYRFSPWLHGRRVVIVHFRLKETL